MIQFIVKYSIITKVSCWMIESSSIIVVQSYEIHSSITDGDGSNEKFYTSTIYGTKHQNARSIREDWR